MALQASVLAMAGDIAGTSGSQTTGGATATQNIGANRLIAVNATQDMQVRFGSASGVAAVAGDFRIPANSTFVFSTAADSAYMSLYNNSGSTATWNWAYLSKF